MYSDTDTLSGGLPHSEIPGSTIARISPGLFAACHVLHRLSVPRHPPDALTLRLSATPDGKDHIWWNLCSTVGGTRSSTGDLVIGATNSPFRRHSHAEPANSSQSSQTGAGGRSARSHNSLLYDCQSTTCQLAPPKRAPPAISGIFLPRSGPAPVGARGPSASRSKLALAPVVEVIGIEPTTPCLQSRCSPS